MRFSNTLKVEQQSFSPQSLSTEMLYCPKCQQNYEEGVQRFCPNDNTRLLSVPTADKAVRQKGSVFSNVIARADQNGAEKFAAAPKFSQVEPINGSRQNSFSSTEKSEENQPELELEIRPKKPSNKSTNPPKLILVKPIVFEETEIEDDSVFDPQNPTAQVGEILLERFLIKSLLEQEENHFKYLAEDKMNADASVIVEIFTGNFTDYDFAGNIFAEEREILADVSHPNLAEIIDCGELSSNAAYLVTENVTGSSVQNYLDKNERFEPVRAARIVRQAADALGAAHKAGVPHRNLKPANICLVTDEDGVERVKVNGFGAAKEKLNEANLLYKSPEQVEGKSSNFTGDEYSLAVIAYQLLTNRLPFNAVAVGDLLRAQREGIKFQASQIGSDLPVSIDDVLKKALAFNQFDRYENIQDFGDEFFGEIFANAPLEIEEDDEEEISEALVSDESFAENKSSQTARTITVADTITIPAIPAEIAEPAFRETVLKESPVKTTADLRWEKRSPEPPNEPTTSRNLLAVLGVAAVVLALLAVWYYFINRTAEQQPSIPVVTANQTETPVETNANIAPTPEEIESPPIARTITPPADSVYFQNSKENLKGDLMKNFLGFSLYYPNGWRQNDAPTNFLDISKNAPSGLPIEQMLITHYNSKGTYKLDEENFPALVKSSNESLKKSLLNYQVVGEGKKTVNNGWQAYEVQFQGTGKANGEEVTIWGKRLFIPTAVRGMKNGYVVTMLATSLSGEVKEAGEVGVKGDLAKILDTFEPNQSF